MNTFLAVGADRETQAQQDTEWAKYDIAALRVDSMYDAIRCLAIGEPFLFVSIEEVALPDFMVELPFLRDAAKMPVFVTAADYSIEKKIQALRCGADCYELPADYLREQVQITLELLKTTSRWASYQETPPDMLINGGIILSAGARAVIVNGTELLLTRKEFDILHCLMAQSGRVLTYKQILQKVWGEEYDENNSILWCTVDRLRAKLSKAGVPGKHIKAVRGMGYKFC